MILLDIRTKKYPGTFSKIDDQFFDSVGGFKWTAQKISKTMYATRRLSKKEGLMLIYLHRVIIKAEKDVLVDHIDGDGLNNQLINLRLANKSQNGQNHKLISTNTSGYMGVSWHKKRKLWQAQIIASSIHYDLGFHLTGFEAAKTRDIAAIKYHGEFAALNFPVGA